MIVNLTAKSYRFGRSHDCAGAALVIVLAFVILLTVFALAFFTRASTDRQISFNSSNQTAADLLARGAIAATLGDLKQELVAGSTVTTVANVTNYQPKPASTPPAIVAPSTIKPFLVGTVGASGTENLVKRSAYQKPFYANASPPSIPHTYDISTYPAPNRAANVSSTSTSLNNRSVSPARWNKPLLLGKQTPASDTDTTPVAPAFTAPDWIIIARGGSNPSAWNPNLITSADNATSAIGRYAYAIYDEGGLLDMNVAGYPTVSTPLQVGRKGRLAYANVAQVPGVSSLTASNQTKIANNIIGWRNFASAGASGNLGTFSSGSMYTFASGTSYYNFATSSTNNFLLASNSTLSSGQTDRMFSSRQQLIKLLLKGMASNGTGATSIAERANLQTALQYLGTFSREKNRATWSPSTPANSTIDYAAQAETSTSINRDLATVRVTTVTTPTTPPMPFNRFDGSPAVLGEPLLKTRFPLTRLSWLTYRGPSAAVYAANNTDPVIVQLLAAGVPLSTIQSGTAANILSYFGLVWDSRAYAATPRAGQQWVYCSPNPANFGGNFNGTTGTEATVIKKLNTVQSEAREPDFFELLKTVILTGSVGLGASNAGNTFVVADPKYYDTTAGKSADYQLMQMGANIIDAWDTDNVPTFVNFNGAEPVGVENLPYLNKLVYIPSFASGSGDFFDAWLVPSLWNPHQNAPGTGTIRVSLDGTGNYTATGNNKTGAALVPTTTSGPIALPATMDIGAAGFGIPTPQTATPIAQTASVTQVTNPSFNYWGFHYPFTSTASTQAVNKTNAESSWPDFGTVVGANSVELRIQIPGTSTFIPYQTWKIAALNHPLISQSGKNNFGTNNKLQDPEFVALDPRTVRFGIWGSDANQSGASAKKDFTQGSTDSLDQQPPAKLQQITLYQPQGSSFVVASLATLSVYSANNQTTTFYRDLDGVQRHADVTTNDGITKGNTIMFPIAPGLNDRPRIFSAPFQSVGELGQVFRDQPWKTLSFTIANSADAGLLDAFTLQEVPLAAGKTSLNTRQIPVLAAIMSQAAMRLDGSIPPLTSAQATAVATDIITITAANPFISKSDLVAQIATKASFTGLGNKEARECVVRALSDACQTRTWNLMIDVIAQSGRYPSTATNLSQFVVEGEKRYWLHVAIDRFTGEVIDQQLEAVYE